MRFLTFIQVVFCILLVHTGVKGQNTFQPKARQIEHVGVLYKSEKTIEIRAHTNGFMLGYNTGRIKTFYKTTYRHFSIGYLKDFREKSQNKNEPSGFPVTSKSFVFGKKNEIINLRAGYGVKRFLSEKARRKGVTVGYDYVIGPTIALTKPYYLKLKYLEDTNGQFNPVLKTEKYTPENADKFTSYKDIFGGAPYAKGLSEIGIIPGIFGKLGFLFSLGSKEKYVKTVETGIMADVFIRKLPIMVETESVTNKFYHINFYVALHLGKRKKW